MLNEFLPDRFLDKVQFEPNSGCWLWVGAVNPDGYGRFWFQGSMQCRDCRRENNRRWRQKKAGEPLNGK